MKNTTIALAVIILIGGALFYFLARDSEPVTTDSEQDPTSEVTDESLETVTEDGEQTAMEPVEVIGSSVEGRDITAYHYGDGDTELLFVGGIHGGYSWNTVLVARELMAFLEENPDVVPDNVKVTVIPVLNPDGVEKVSGIESRFEPSGAALSLEATIPGRFNANDVDLNRNFDCKWQSTGTWQSRTVDGGSEVFSEPESQAIRNYVESHELSAAVVWYSAAGGVYSSSCHNGISSETLTITNLYADASGYNAYEEFDFYEVTGDMVNWLAKSDIPAISVLLTTHQDVEWDKNKAGLEALLLHYAK